MGFQVSLDSDLERHCAGWAAYASTVKPNLNDPLGGDAHKFEVAAIGLHSRPNQVNYLRHLVAHAVG